MIELKKMCRIKWSKWSKSAYSATEKTILLNNLPGKQLYKKGTPTSNLMQSIPSLIFSIKNPLFCRKYIQ